MVDFPGDPLVKTLHSQCRGPEFDPWLGFLLLFFFFFFFFGGSNGKESACNAGDPGSIPGSGRSPGEENDNPLQYFGLENPMGRGTW